MLYVEFRERKLKEPAKLTVMKYLLTSAAQVLRFPGGASGKEPGCLFRRQKRHGFSPWVRKIPCPGEGNGNPFQCSCLENPMDRGTWQAAVYGIEKSGTRLKRFSMRAQHGG